MGVILLFIGVIKSYWLVQEVEPQSLVSFVPLLIITASLLLNLKFVIQPSFSVDLHLKHYSPLHDIIHIAGIGMMTMLLWKLLPT
jgi:hypothetical protein